MAQKELPSKWPQSCESRDRAHKRAKACFGRRGSRSSRIAGSRGESSEALPATEAGTISDDGLCKGRSGSLRRNAARSLAAVTRERDGWQQAAGRTVDARIFHVRG
jgi:hypothetical protein